MERLQCKDDDSGEGPSASPIEIGVAERGVPVGHADGIAAVRDHRFSVAQAGSVLVVDVSCDHRGATLRLAGNLHTGNVRELGGQLAALIGAGHTTVSVVTDRLDHVPPVCAGVLNRAAAELIATGGSLAVIGVSAADAETLRRAGLADSIVVIDRDSTAHPHEP